MATEDEVEFWKNQCRKLTAALERIETENDKIRKLLRQDYDFMVHLNICEAYPSSDDLSIQRYLMHEVGVCVEPEDYT